MTETEFDRRPGGWRFTAGGGIHLFYWLNAEDLVTVCGAKHDKYIPSYANDRITCRKCRRITKRDHPEWEVYLDNPTGVEPVNREDAEAAFAAASTNTQYAEWARTYGKQLLQELRLYL